MRVRVKICGITGEDDARAAIDAGADALGFIFYPASPRFVSVRRAAQAARVVPPFVARVGVFVNPNNEQVVEAMTECGLDVLQFHGEESPAFCTAFGRKAVKAFRVRDESSLKELPAFPVDAWLLDSHVPDKPGGSGERFNWNLAVAAKRYGRPIILAGGLTPENVAEAVRLVQPFAVDVSSGVEAAPGKKDVEKMRAFVRTAKGA
jgi:phosphoribosylanthranilate isomerase